MKRIALTILFCSVSIICWSQTPIGYWPIHGDLIDQNGSMNGVVTGATLVSGKNADLNGAYEFDGSNNYAELTNSKTGLDFIHKTGVFTISMYVKFNSLTDNQTLIGSVGSQGMRGFFMGFSGTGSSRRLSFLITNGSSNWWATYGTYGRISDSNWHHVSVVGSGNSVQIYVDGTKDGAAVTNPTGSLTQDNASYNAVVGGYRLAGGEIPLDTRLNGAVDEIKIFNFSMSDQDVLNESTSISSSSLTGTGVWSVDSQSNIFYNSGNVGINTDLPSQRLHVNGSSRFDSWIVGNSNTGILEIYGDQEATEGVFIKDSGNVGIGTSTPGNRLEVNGTIRAKKVKVEISGWPDYVFESSYSLRSLSEVERFIRLNNHLPEVPSALNVEKNGVDLGEMHAILLKKIEELTLYTIQQEKKLEVQKKNNEALKKQLSGLLQRLERLEKK